MDQLHAVKNAVQGLQTPRPKDQCITFCLPSGLFIGMEDTHTVANVTEIMAVARTSS